MVDGDGGLASEANLVAIRLGISKVTPNDWLEISLPGRSGEEGLSILHGLKDGLSVEVGGKHVGVD